MSIALCGTMGYLLGMVNQAYIIGRLRVFDILQRGSCNAGATNVTLIMGKLAGLICALLDIFKSYAAYKLAKWLFPMLSFAGVLAGCACVLGHIFPAWMQFSGGKGLACIGGLILAYDKKVFALMLLAEIVLALIVNYIIVVPLSAVVVFPALYLLQTGEVIGTLLLLALIPVVYYKHLPNIRRLMKGQEARLSWLWSPEKEEARLKESIPDAEWKRLYMKVNKK